MRPEAICESLIGRIRERRPLIHHITNYVVANFSANVSLALGASPVMAHSALEVEEMVSRASALVLNCGTLDGSVASSIWRAARRASELQIPVVFDPVGAGATSYRTLFCRAFLEEFNPAVVKGNAGEVSVLSGLGGEVRGVESLSSSDPLRAALRLSRDLGSVVVATGEVDFVCSPRRAFAVRNGHPLMGRITGSGCAAGSVVASFLAVSDGEDAALVCALAMAYFGLCGEVASARASGPGSFASALLDQLASEDLSFLEGLRLEEVDLEGL